MGTRVSERGISSFVLATLSACALGLGWLLPDGRFLLSTFGACVLIAGCAVACGRSERGHRDWIVLAAAAFAASLWPWSIPGMELRR